MLCKPGLWSLCGCSYPQCFQLHVRMPFIKVPGRQKNGKRSCRFSIKLSQIWLRRNHGDQYNSFLQRASVAASATQWCSPAAMVLKHTIDHHDMFYYNTTFCQKKNKQFSIEKWSLESLNVFFSGRAQHRVCWWARRGRELHTEQEIKKNKKKMVRLTLIGINVTFLCARSRTEKRGEVRRRDAKREESKRNRVRSEYCAINSCLSLQAC